MTEQQELDPEVEENLEAARSLQSFGKGLNTLVDDAAEVVQTDYDAAASVMKQWVGHVNSEES